MKLKKIKGKKFTIHINIGIIKIEKATMVYNTARSMIIKLGPSRHGGSTRWPDWSE
jgi:hypothetical protein